MKLAGRMLARFGDRSTGGVLGNFLAVSVGNLASRVIAFVAVAYLARTLGPTTYGQVLWAQAALSFGIVFADSGLQTLGIRIIAQKGGPSAPLAAEVFRLRFVTHAATSMLLIGLGVLLAPTRTTMLLTVLYGASLLANGVVIEWVFTGMQRIGVIGVSRIVQYVTYAALLLLFVHGSGDALRVPVASAAGIVAAGTLLLATFLAGQPGFRLGGATAQWRPLLREAFPLGASYLVTQLYVSLPVLLLGWMRGETAAGYYGAAYRLVQVPYEFMMLFLLTLYPVAAGYWGRSPQTVGRLLERLLKLVFVVTFPVAMLATVLGPQLIRLALGGGFQMSVLPFRLLIWVVLVVGYSGVLAHLGLLMNGRHKAFFAVVTGGAAISVLLNLLLIPRLSHIGASVAWGAAEVGVLGASWWMVRRSVAISPWRGLGGPAVAGAAMGTTCWLSHSLGSPLWLVVLLGVVVYAAAMSLLRGFTKDDLLFVSQLSSGGGAREVGPA